MAYRDANFFPWGSRENMDALFIDSEAPIEKNNIASADGNENGHAGSAHRNNIDVV